MKSSNVRSVLVKMNCNFWEFRAHQRMVVVSFPATYVDENTVSCDLTCLNDYPDSFSFSLYAFTFSPEEKLDPNMFR